MSAAITGAAKATRAIKMSNLFISTPPFLPGVNLSGRWNDFFLQLLILFLKRIKIEKGIVPVY